MPSMNDLLDRLGLAGTRRAVVVSLDELGLCLAANEAVYAALRAGSAGTSASLLVPAPWARGAAADHRGEDVGVQLTLNAEHDRYRWGPLTHAPSLLDGDGGFPRTIEDVWEHADLEEVRREWKAQVERAILWGFDVTHLTCHLPEVPMKPEFFDAYLDLAEELRLPIRLPDSGQEPTVGFPFRALAEERGVLAPERVVTLGGEDGPDTATGLAELLLDLPEGLSELRLRPAEDSAELRRATPRDWADRVEGGRLAGPGGPLAQALQQTGIAAVGYRRLRGLMRSELDVLPRDS